MAERRVEARPLHVRERRVPLLQRLHFGELIERRRIRAMEPQRDRRVEDLLHRLRAEPELVGAAHLVDEVRRDDFSGLRVAREAGERVVAPRPFLEHL